MKKTAATASVATAISCALAATCCVLCASDSAAAAPFTYELFDFVGCYADTNIRVPESTGIAEARRGLRICAAESGASARLKTDVGGVFDFEFLPYSTTAYGGGDYESATYSNSYQDVRAMSLVFTDAADSANNFTVKLTGGADGNNVTVNASVAANGERAGIYYYKDSAARGNTTGSNGNGVYTFLYGASFSNTAVSGGLYSPASVKPVRVVFDPSDMRVYGYNYGYGVNTAEKRLIWDFSSPTNDGRDLGFTLDGFDKYSVSLVFDDIKSGAEGNVIAYSLNGYDLGGSVMPSKGPACYCAKPEGAIAGERIALPAPACYDPVGGTTEFAGVVRLTDPDGAVVELVSNDAALAADANGFAEWKSGLTATLDKAGVYVLAYKAKNAAGVYGDAYETTFVVEDGGRLQFEPWTEKYDYDKGATLVAPKGYFIVGGAKREAELAVLDPDGKALAAPYALEKAGRYTAVYTAETEGRTLEGRAYFYSLERHGSLFECGGGMTAATGESGLHSELVGLIATSAVNNGTITYAAPVSIKTKTKNDTLVSLMALPKRYGAAAFGQVEIRLTDKTDPDNYVTVIVTGGDGGDTSKVRAASAAQPLSGLNGSGAIESFSGGGTTILHSFNGVANYADIRDQLIDIRMDYAQKRVYAGDRLVCDLDDSEHFVKTWNGFVGDEAILSITVRDMYADSASLLITEADGKRIAGEYYRDCVTPVIAAGFDERDVPRAIVGRKFPILPVTVTDNEDKNPRVTARVTDERGATVSVADGGFVPTAAGKYDITFVASDYTGNVATRTFTVTATERADELTVAPSTAFSQSVRVGEALRLPDAVVTGGCGLNRITVTAVGKATGTEYRLGAGDTLKITVADEYELIYAVTDYLGNRAEHKSAFTAAVSAQPIFDGDLPDLPNIFIAGNRYVLPAATAFDYKANKAATVEVGVSVDGVSAKKLGADLAFIPEISGASAVITVIYTAIAADGEQATMRADVPAVALTDGNGNLDITRYFMTENVDRVTANDECLTFDVTQSAAKISFVKEVYAHGFELLFDVPSAANNADSVAITVADAIDKNKRVVFEVFKGGFADGSSRVSVNGLQDMTITGNFYDAIMHMRIAYANDNYAIKDATGLTVGFVKYYADGTQFRGFSDTVTFDIELRGVSGVCELRLYRLGNQLLMENDGDYTPPVIVAEGEMQRSVRRGDTLTVARAKAYDVLGFETELSVSVRSGDRTLLTDAPCDVTHELTLDEYGEYFVTYTATDENYNVNNYSLVVNVRDDVPPEIKADATERVVRVGDVVEIAAAEITDDVQVDRTYIFVIDTMSNMLDVTQTRAFVPVRKGVYTIRYVAFDTAGNMGITDVTVKAAQ